MKIYFVSLAVISLAFFSCASQSPEKEIKEVQPEAITDTASNTLFTITAKQDSVTENGESIVRYESGAIKMRGIMKDGKREGLWKSWYEDGKQWSETTFAAGIKNGKTTTWYENGNKRYTGIYTNDLESGKWTYWDESGKEVSTKDYGKK